MKQMTFADAEYAGKRKQTRKELFLIEMDRVVPWKGLIALIEPHYPKGEGGRPAYPLMAMLRVHLMQNWFGYSDPAMEEALYETTILRQFAGLLASCVVVTVLFYRILAALDTPNLAFSTLSVITSFLAAALTMLRSSYYALGYAANDVVLIVLWLLASLTNSGYLPVAVNFIIFFFNDLYGFISWKKREVLQA